MAVKLENFKTPAVVTSRNPPDVVAPAQAEADKVTSYEQGYQAGWDDALRAEAQQQSRISADFARNLQEVSFSFHEARAHLVKATVPLLNQLVDAVLPEIAKKTLGLRLMEEMQSLMEDSIDGTIDLMVSPESRLVLERQLPESSTAQIRLIEEPALAEGQVFLRVGKIEREIDIARVQACISDAIQSFNTINLEALKHA